MLTSEESAKREELKSKKPAVYDKVMRYSDKLKRGESIAIIQFQYDYRCNFACEHCDIFHFRTKQKARHFTIEDVKQLSKQADKLGLAHWVITGGEPLEFPDFDYLVGAINPQKFYITTDTNGWNLDRKRALRIKEIGVDKVQLSLDSLNAIAHDAFRRKPGSHERALKAIDYCKEAGLNIIVATVVTKHRLHNKEFISFLDFLAEKKTPCFVSFAKPVGAWEGNTDTLISKDDLKYLSQLSKMYNVFTHLTTAYGLDIGCIAVKRMISITKYGEVMPCPYIHRSLGNVFEESLDMILKRGMQTFSDHVDICPIAMDKKFIGVLSDGNNHLRQGRLRKMQGC